MVQLEKILVFFFFPLLLFSLIFFPQKESGKENESNSVVEQKNQELPVTGFLFALLSLVFIYLMSTLCIIDTRVIMEYRFIIPLYLQCDLSSLHCAIQGKKKKG